MTNGAEIPFRHSRRAPNATGSLIFDRERDEHLREAGKDDQPMQIWFKGHFVRA